jgi:hypothetical protein
MKNVPVTLNIKGLTDVEKEQLSTMFENAGRVLRNMLAMKGRDPDKLTITVTESN